MGLQIAAKAGAEWISPPMKLSPVAEIVSPSPASNKLFAPCHSETCMWQPLPVRLLNGFGFISGHNSEIDVFPDKDCPGGEAYLLDMRSWCLRSMRKAPQILDLDGLEMLRTANADGVEMRGMLTVGMDINRN